MTVTGLKPGRGGSGGSGGDGSGISAIASATDYTSGSRGDGLPLVWDAATSKLKHAAVSPHGVIVAASNAPAAWKAAAKASGGAVCDGTNDDVEIQAAIRSVRGATWFGSGTGGGVVTLSPGLFTIAKPLFVPIRTRLLGQATDDQGQGTTVKLADGANCDGIVCEGATSTSVWWHSGEIGHLYLDGNKANNSYGTGVVVGGMGESASVHHVNAQNWATDGMLVMGGTPDHLHHCQAFFNGRHGFNLIDCTHLTALMLSGDGNTGSLIRTRCAPNGAMSQYTFVGIKCERNPSHPTAHDPAIYLDNMVAPVTIIGVTMDGSGATTAAAIRRENPTRDTKHFVVIVGSPTGGTWTLNGSAAIAYNATAAQVQTALEGVHGAGNVSVIGGTGPDTSWQVEYIGALANTHVSNPTTTSSLTGGNAPTVFARRMQYGNNGGTPNGIVEVRGGRTLGYTAQFDDLVDPANTISLGSGSVTFSKPAYPHDVTLEFVIDGGGSAITTGVKGDLILPPWAGVITGVQLLADQSGSIVVDLWKDDYAHYPPTVADTITASAKPTLSSATKYTDSTLTGWTTAFSAGDTLRLNVDSASTLTRCLVALTVRRPVV